MARKMLKINVLILILALFCSVFSGIFFSKSYSANAQERELLSEITTYDNAEKNERLIKLTNAHIDKIMDDGLQIERIKTLKDFDSGIYTLFELAPTGYIIYHSNSGQFVEYTSISPSPYKGFDGELYYGGMMQYYYRDGEVLQHTLKSDTIIMYEDRLDYAESCREIDVALCAEAELDNLSYIEGESSLATVSFTGKTVVAGTNATRTPSITMSDFFGKLKTSSDIGYRGGGVCGYIATNLMIGYNYFAYDRGLINDTSFVNETNKTMNGAGLTNYLLEIAGEDPKESSFSGTAANDAYGYMKEYFKKVYNRCSWSYGWRLFKINAYDSIEAGHPVTLYGNFKNAQDESKKINHAVVAYGYEDGHYIVHYGWPNYPRVSTAGGLIGTTFYMNISD